MVVYVLFNFTGVVNHGFLEEHAGAIQAALNLEIHSTRISHIDVKVAGLNGQLPNLDLVNLVHRICSKEGIRSTFYNKDSKVKINSAALVILYIVFIYLIKFFFNNL